MKKYMHILSAVILLFSSMPAASSAPPETPTAITSRNGDQSYNLVEITRDLDSTRRQLDTAQREFSITCHDLNLSLREVKQIITNHAFYAAQHNPSPLPNFQAQAPSTTPSMPNITIHMSQNPQLSATQATAQETTTQVEAEAQAENTATNITDVKTDVTTVQTNEQHQTVINTIYEKAEAAGTYFGITKTKLIFGTIASSYIGLFARLISDNYFLKRSDAWSSWKQDITLEQLCILPRNNLLNQLQQDIQNKYINPKNPINFVKPLTQFVNETDYEMARIQKYITLTTWLSRLCLSYFFPINQEMLSLAQERVARLAFVRSLFNAWAADYKIEMAQHAPRHKRL